MTQKTIQIREVGTIKEIKNSIAKITGLKRIMTGQLLQITSNTKGLVIGFSRDEVSIFLLGRIEEVKIGDPVHSHLEPFTIPVGTKFLGRIVNALTNPVDGGEPIRHNDYYPVFRPAPGVLQRAPIDEPLETGSLMIDSTIPIGKGQRELIIGDRMTGKTSLCVDAIINQKNKNVICIYCCIGRSYTALQKVVESLKQNNALSYTIVVAATAASCSGEQYLVPYTACTLGEYFMDRGKNVLVVFDDLTKHAWVYRQLSLLLERAPGRDAYPGDIFYLHSQLMERAGKYNEEFKSGSMTFLPVADTIQGDVTGYIPSNLISMTDGQIYMNATLFKSGFKPAIDLSLSISRIGNKAQSPAIKELSQTLRLDYIQYTKLLKITQFKTAIPEAIMQQFQRGETITKIFTQKHSTPYSVEKQIILLYAVKRDILNVLSKDLINHFKDHIFTFTQNQFPEIIEELSQKKALNPELKKKLNACFIDFFKH